MSALNLISILYAGIIVTALSSAAVTLDCSFGQVSVNGTAYPNSGALTVWINANNSVVNQVDDWMEWGLDGSGNDNRTLFQFALPQTSSGNFSLSDVQFGVHDDWGNYQPWHLHTTLPFNSSATWSNPGSGVPAGGALLVDCGDNSSGDAAGSELVWDSQAGVGASQAWVYPPTNLLAVAAASLTSTNPVDLIFDTDWGNWINDGGSAPCLQLTLTSAYGPPIVNQPAVAPSATVYSGNAIALSVVAATDYAPAFQWYKDGAVINPAVKLNATVTSTNGYDSELILTNLATTDSGHIM